MKEHDQSLAESLALCVLLILVCPAFGWGSDADKSVAQIFEERGNAVVVITNLGLADAPQAVGTGFIVQPNGIVLTNYHVIEHAHAVAVRLPDGREFRALGILGSDSDLDVAVLKLDATGLPVMPLGDSDGVKVGQRIVAIGNPLGMLEFTVSDGIISAIRLPDASDPKDQKLIQITAPLSQGNSGGPLLDLNGRVIGITFAVIEVGQNLNFAIPINTAKPFVKDGPVAALDTLKKDVLFPMMSDCPALGNANSGIYHLPGGAYYAQMQFSPSAVCLKSEEEASKQGYRRALR